MPRFPETHSLLEQAARHVLSTQGKLLKRADAQELKGLLLSLNELAVETTNVLAKGFDPNISTSHLTKLARKLETDTDDLSETLWTHIDISVSAIYERIEESLLTKPGKRGVAADLRAHYHNLRIGLLEQMIGA